MFLVSTNNTARKTWRFLYRSHRRGDLKAGYAASRYGITISNLSGCIRTANLGDAMVQGLQSLLMANRHNMERDTYIEFLRVIRSLRTGVKS